MIKKLLTGFAFHRMLLFLCLVLTQSYAQEKLSVIGTVTDSAGVPLPGVSVIVTGTKSGTATDVNGKFVLDVSSGAVLAFKFVGYHGDTVKVSPQNRVLSIVMRSAETVLSDFVVTAFGKKQIKESVVGSVSTIKPDDLRTAGSNLTNALAGQVAGVIGFQQSGQPGLDNSNFFIRGVTTFGYRQNPLILIDNVELEANDLARLQVNDIASFSILKDASATALYGARGANGVILVTTKEGKAGKTNLNLILENAISAPTETIKLADPVTYMKLYNEASTGRDPLTPPLFTADKIYNTEQTMKNAPGSNPYVYPAVDWLGMLFRKSSNNQRANLNVNGGGEIARFVVSGSFSNDNGMLKRNVANNFNNNVNFKNYQLRSNINVKLTKSTEMVLRLWGNFNDYSGPVTNDASFSSDLYSAAVHTSPVLFPAFYEPDSANRLTQHILFGNSAVEGAVGGVAYSNPYAQMLRGYKRFSESRMSATVELHQDLDFITPGLKFHGFFNTNRYSYFDNTMAYNPFYYTVKPEDYNRAKNIYNLTWLNNLPGLVFLGGTGSGSSLAATEYLNYTPGRKDANTFLQLQAQLEYSKQMGDHNVAASLIGVRQQKLVANGVIPNTNTPSLQYSLPYRNLNLAGRVSYNFASRYFAEFNFGYNGSERFSEDHRYGFFPTIGASWMLSREKFWQGGIADVINSFKLRASYGMSGNDDIGQQRFFYLSDVNLNAGNGAVFGLNNSYPRAGVQIRNYENRNVTWETAKIMNTGIELTVLKDFDFIAEYWTQERRNIVMGRPIPTSMGLEAGILTNVGTVDIKGLDLTANYNHYFNKDLRLMMMSNFTYSKGTYGVYEEPEFPNQPWRYVSGTMLKQEFGYIAERLFVDDKEVAASPTQQFGDGAKLPRGGDIKYRDLNGDGRITVADQAPIGLPTTPQVMYGFGFSLNYKGFELAARFQGQSRVSLFIDPRSVSPFVIPRSPQIQSASQVLQAFADDHWSEENQDLYALYPRMGTSAQVVENNLQRSTWWMRDGSFLRLKTAEIGYVLPLDIVKRLHLKYCRLYVNGINLFNITKFDLWDPELGGNGFSYPIQKAYNLGINVNL